ncbi:BMP family lipoprotein [Acrocarpospora catenulata]|uniref:BMP family lipoprotein n=1 Tax=Acrocarpospora catenulata TaxID=2836182 RepID=UPI001BDB0A6E|nr:BMP family ABC transporter substrate-binding protein [Acrocarpospora catenulata]
MRPIGATASTTLLAALVAAGCAIEDDPVEIPTHGPPTRVGLAYDIGGRGDRSFNDSAAFGLDRAEAELGVETTEMPAGNGETDGHRAERLRALAKEGHNPVIAVGFVYSGAVSRVAAEFPDVKFAIVDDPGARGPNISNLLFAENEGSFLVGAAGALKSRTNKLGFVGGVNVPQLHKFEAGYRAGIQHVKPAEVRSRYLSDPPDLSGFTDPAKGRAAAQGMYDSGVDVVFQATGGSGSGVFEAARDTGDWAIGVDSDQAKTADPEVRGSILTSMLKKVDVAVFDFIHGVVKGDFRSGPVVYDLKAGGVDYATTGGHLTDIVPQLNQLKRQIIDGRIKVPTH